MSKSGDYEDINFYGINVFYGKVIAVYFLPFKKNHPVNIELREGGGIQFAVEG